LLQWTRRWKSLILSCFTSILCL